MEHEIFNHRHSQNFTVIPNALLQDTNLSLYARGVLVYLLSLPPGWVINVANVAETFGETESKILKALRELIALGYCLRTPKRGEGGKVCGQRYQISDIAGDFTVPSKNRGAAATDPAFLPTTEKNGGRCNNNIYNKKNINISDNKENREDACACGDAPTPPISESLFADDNDYVKEERKRAKRTNERRKILFADSRYFDYDKFAAEFTEEEHRKADIYAYYQAIKNWSASEGGKKMDWIATAKKWMLMDEKKGKLIKPGNQGLSPEELKYLQDMAPSDFELGITR